MRLWLLQISQNPNRGPKCYHVFLIVKLRKLRKAMYMKDGSLILYNVIVVLSLGFWLLTCFNNAYGWLYYFAIFSQTSIIWYWQIAHWLSSIIYIYICIPGWRMYIHKQARAHVCVHARMYGYFSIGAHAYGHVRTKLYIYIHIYICICVCVYRF